HVHDDRGRVGRGVRRGASGDRRRPRLEPARIPRPQGRHPTGMDRRARRQGRQARARPGGGRMRSELFAEANQETQSTERWVKQSSKMLRINVSGGGVVLAAKGAMVAYQGQMEFQHEGAGAGRMLKKLVTGEGAPLMRIRGEGEVFLARDAANVFTVLLEGEGLSVSGKNLRAFDP